MVNFKLSGGVAPVLPVNFLAGISPQKITIKNPYCVNALAELPPGKPIFAAYHFQVSADIPAGKGLDLAPGMGLNKPLNTPYIPPSSLLGDRSITEADQVAIKKCAVASGRERKLKCYPDSVIRTIGRFRTITQKHDSA